MSRYGFSCCSCGSSMLKPTLRPPPSLQPRFAASMTPGPPPVITAQPCSPKSFAVARAAAYTGESCPTRAGGANGLAAVEEADREHVESVEQERDVREHDELRRSLCGADRPDRRGRAAAEEWTGERDERVPPWSEPGPLDRHVGPDERDERRQRHLEPLPACLDHMAELVHEQHEDEAERERPAVKPERVRRDGDEEAEELDEDEPPLERGAADQHGEPARALERAAQAALRVNRRLGPELVHVWRG